MSEIANEKTCLACGKPLQGRIDKKFCDDYCRNTYNNQTKSASNNLVRNINNALKKNRNLLEAIVPEGEVMAKVHRDKLTQGGFQFRYMTHNYTNRKGNIYYYCYDYGYLPLENDWFLVVKGREE
ncbi:MAG: hypothetical protein RIB86_01895 [Imperialibacter sp.]